MTRGEIAQEYFKAGYNCSQAVFLSFMDEIGINEEIAALISASFGGGMGRMREVCGAISGELMALGALRKGSNTKIPEQKKALYADTQRLINGFKDEFGSYLCRDLLGVTGPEEPAPAVRDDAYFASRPCLRCVYFAAEQLDREMNK